MIVNGGLLRQWENYQMDEKPVGASEGVVSIIPLLLALGIMIWAWRK